MSWRRRRPTDLTLSWPLPGLIGAERMAASGASLKYLPSNTKNEAENSNLIQVQKMQQKQNYKLG
jgi:hypothetical protein